MRYISLFSGIEAATVAWSGLGWEPVAFAEIEPFPCAVLAYRFPDVPNLGDVTKIRWEDVIEEHGAIDIVVGGSPCQSFSVAGGRASLDGESALCFEYWRAVRDIRPRWFLWENVPGVFSTRDNAFGQFLGKLENIGYGMAWRTLDAQFFGVAQRRRRVFLVGCLGGIGSAAAVLFESRSVSGNTQSSNKKREALAAEARGCAEDAVCIQTDHLSQNGKNYHVGVSKTLDTQGPPAVFVKSRRAATCDDHETWKPGEVANTLNTFDTGDKRANELVVYREGSFAQLVEDDVCGPVRASGGTLGGGSESLVAEPVVMKVRCGKDTYTKKDGTIGTAGKGALISEDVDLTLSATQDMVLFCRSGTQANSEEYADLAPAETARQFKDPHIVYGTDRVRRLTPLECERLQGFPDGWTDIPYKGKPAPDGPRYKALGNSFAVPVIRWLGERIQMVEEVRDELSDGRSLL